MFLNPNGRLSSYGFIRAGYILILIGIAFQILAMVNFELAQKVNFLSYLLIYPWIVIWIKRLHNGNQPGLMFLAYLALYTILSVASFTIVEFVFGEGMFWQIAMEMNSGQLSDAEIQERMTKWVKKILLPSTVSSTIVSLLTLHIGDKTIPSDSGDNKYGARPSV